METIDYQKQATDFLARNGLCLKVEFAGKDCPEWGGEKAKFKTACPKCGGVHGWKWIVSIWRADPFDGTKSRKPGTVALEFPFWNSWADTHIDYPKGRDFQGVVVWFEDKRLSDVKGPTAYDVLACISGDANCPESFEEFCSEYGYDPDSRRTEATWRRCLEFAYRLNRFFTDAELEELAEIN